MANIAHRWKRGNQREDGKFFLRKTDKKEYWGDKDDLEKIRRQAIESRERLRKNKSYYENKRKVEHQYRNNLKIKNQHKPRIFKRGHVREDGKVFLNYNFGQEIWVSSERLKKERELAAKRKRENRKGNALVNFKERVKNRVRYCFKNLPSKKCWTTEKLLGCSVHDAWNYLVLKTNRKESEIKEKFSNGELHIDHIIPLCSAKTIEETIALSHFSNLQLLDCVENRTKSDFLPNGQRARFINKK
jgi:hypothetical protein